MSRLPGRKTPLSTMTVIIGLFGWASVLIIPACGGGGSSQPTLINGPNATPSPMATPASSPTPRPTPPSSTPAPPSATPAPTPSPTGTPTPTSSPSPTPAPPQTVNIPVVGMSFGAPVTVKAGSRVTWVNQSALLHSVIWDSRTPANAPPPGPNLAVFAGGTNSSVWVAPTVTTRTDYNYHCGIHGLMMSGKITVTP